MAGQGAKRRATRRRAQAKSAHKKALRQREKLIASLPKISEEDLLAFQLAHFNDDTCPETWFVDPETALNCGTLEDDDGLGYYDDGVKRTLTDEQIAIFRRTELWQMKRDQMRTEPEDDDREADVDEGVLSDASSLEDDLLGYVGPGVERERPAKVTGPAPVEPEPEHQSHAADSASTWKNRRSEQEIPYDQRHKRKWENYVHDVDPVEGSLTHRRMARELDDQKHESVDMDY